MATVCSATRKDARGMRTRFSRAKVITQLVFEEVDQVIGSGGRQMRGLRGVPAGGWTSVAAKLALIYAGLSSHTALHLWHGTHLHRLAESNQLRHDEVTKSVVKGELSRCLSGKTPVAELRYVRCLAYVFSSTYLVPTMGQGMEESRPFQSSNIHRPMFDMQMLY
jgi:hypothetical protein